MKTAMQQLIEKLNYSIQNSKGDYKVQFAWLKLHCLILLEQEKEQIIDAFKSGWNWNFSAEEYYDKTFKQEGLDDEAREILNNL